MKILLKYPLLFLAIIGVITIFFAIQIPNITIDNSLVAFIPEDHEEFTALNKSAELFGQDSALLIGFELTEGDIFEPGFIEFLFELTDVAQTFPDAGAPQSLVTLPGIDRTMPPEIIGAQLRGMVQNSTTYQDIFVTRSPYRITQFIIPVFVTSDYATNETTYSMLENFLVEKDYPNLKWYLGGPPALIVSFTDNIRTDLTFLIPILAAMMIITLILVFRQTSGVLMPLIMTSIGAVWVMGILALMDIQITLILMLIPVILMAIVNAYGIHILHNYFLLLQDSPTLPTTKKEHSEVIIAASRKIFGPIIVSVLTTMAGFGSLSFSTVPSIRLFGIFVAIGVGVGFILSQTFAPIVLQLFYKKMIASAQRRKYRKASWLTKIEHYSIILMKKTKWINVLIACIMVGVGIWGITRLDIDNNLIKFFLPNSTVRIAEKFFIENFQGADILDVVVEAEGDNTIADAELIEALRQITNEVAQYRVNEDTQPLSISSILTILDQYIPSGASSGGTPSTSVHFLTTLHHTFSENPAFASASPEEIIAYLSAAPSPQTQQLLPYFQIYDQYLTQWIDDPISPKNAKMNIVLPASDSKSVNQIITYIENLFEEHIPTGYTYYTTGSSKINVTVTNLLTSTLLISLLISFFTVLFIVTFTLRSFLVGLISVVPIMLTITFSYGMMGILRIPLDVSTSMIASIALGVGIDYSIHFMSNYKFFSLKEKSLDTVLQRALHSSGRAIMYNALTVAAGFGILTFSRFVPLIRLGIFTAVLMIFSAIAVIVLLPIMLQVRKIDYQSLHK